MAEDIFDKINGTDAVTIGIEVADVVTNNSTIEVDVSESAMSELVSEVDVSGHDTPAATVEESVPFEVSVEEFAGASTSTNIVTNHTSSGSNQHTIGAITGLREELDDIKKLKTVYSNNKYHANYFMWDEVPANAVGLFVTMCDGVDKIRVCTSADDVFGVTVPKAAFVGGQDDIARNDSYGLVSNSGLAYVQCESNVAVGDYVVSNDRGEAKKSAGNYGYLVTALEYLNGVSCAVISLTSSSSLAQSMSDDVRNLTGRMSTAEYNITSVGNVANSAYSLAQDAKENAEVNSEYIEEKITEVLDRMDVADDTIGNLSVSVNNACESAALAKTIAESAVSSAESIRNEAVNKANDALDAAAVTRNDLETTAAILNNTIKDVQDEIGDVKGGLNDFKEEVTDTYVTHTDFSTFQSETAESIATVKREASETYATIESVTSLRTDTSQALSGFKQEVSDIYATNTALAQLKTDTTDAIAASEQNATETYATQTDLTAFKSTTNESMATLTQKADANGASIEALVSNIDKCGVGEYSQAYNLTLDQAKNILPVSTVYVPTTNHTEVYDDTYTQEFLKGYYYTWNGAQWVPSASVSVFFSNEYVTGTPATPYWVVETSDVVEDGVTYDLGGLYLWQDDAWVKMASVTDNTMSRAVSAVKQTADSVSAEVVSTKGDISSLTARVGDTESSLQTVTSWQSDTTSKIATIEQKTNDNTSSIALVVSEEDGKKGVNSASIVTAINDGESSATIKADKINFEGFTTFVRPGDIGEGGTTSIDGANIKTGKIAAERLDIDGVITVGKIATDSSVDNKISETEAKIPTDAEITTITNNTISTTNVVAQNLKVKAANVDGKLTANQIAADAITADHLSTDAITSENYNGPNGTTGAKLNLADGSFDSKSLKWDAAGKITASAGQIGGWNINDASLTSTGNNIGLYPNPTNTTDCVIWVGNGTAAQAPFQVLKDGTVKIYKGGLTINSEGKAGLFGLLKVSNEMSLDEHNCRFMYSGTLGTDHIEVGFDLANNTNGLYIANATGIYTSYSKTTARTWFLGRDIVPSDTGVKVTEGITLNYGLAMYTHGDTTDLRISQYTLEPTTSYDSTIPVPLTIKADQLCLATRPMISGVSGSGAAASVVTSDYQTSLRLMSLSNIIFLTPETTNENTTAQGYLSGTWKAAACLATSSDGNLKNSIEPLSDNYTTLFDNLNPVRFRYNDGTSNRYHTGFIAQDVESAIQIAGLTTGDCGAYIHDTYSGTRSIRYEEIIALCVNEIQKLKARVIELENKEQKGETI